MAKDGLELLDGSNQLKTIFRRPFVEDAMTKSCETCRYCYFNEGYWCTRWPKWESLPSDHFCGEHKAIPMTPKEKKSTDEKWLIFYNAYPRKVKRAKVEQWFAQKSPSSDDVERMLNCIKLQSAYGGDLYISPQLSKTERIKRQKYIPHPTTWLNDGDWQVVPTNRAMVASVETEKQESASKNRLARLKAIDDKRQKVGKYFEEQPTAILKHILKDNKLDELTLCIVKETLEQRN